VFNVLVNAKKRNLEAAVRDRHIEVQLSPFRKYRVIRNDCRGFNNLSYTIHLR